MTTISDVAARAGVSTATVSRVLNGKVVREDLAAAVRRAAQELDYSPNRIARSLRRQAGDVVALILPDIENPFYTSLARGVEDVAQEAGFSVVLCNSDDSPEKEERYLVIAQSENMAGVILAPASSTPSLTRFRSRSHAVVVVDRPVADDVDQVTFDNVALGLSATAELVSRGFHRIACITGPTVTRTANDRAAGWRQALGDAGLDAPDDYIVRANFRVDGGRRAMASLLALEVPPDAVVATNNLVGVGMLQVLAEASSPERELGVAVIGDLPFVTSRLDHLTLLPLRPREMGLAAAHMLMERVQGSAVPARQVVQPVGGITSAARVLRQ